MPDYTETIRDLKSALRKEVDDARRNQLIANLEQFDREHRELRVEVTNLRLANAVACSPEKARDIAKEAVGVLTERVANLDYLVKAIIIASIGQIVGGIVLAVIIHGIKP